MARFWICFREAKGILDSLDVGHEIKRVKNSPQDYSERMELPFTQLGKTVGGAGQLIHDFPALSEASTVAQGLQVRPSPLPSQESSGLPGEA